MSEFMALFLDAPTFSTLEEEVTWLREQLMKEREARLKLDEELDLLAFDNERLKGLLATSGTRPAVAPTISSGDNVAVDNGGLADLLQEGDGRFADTVVTRIDNACGGMNALCVAFCPHPTAATGSWAVACGGVDKVLRVYSVPWLTLPTSPSSSSSEAPRLLLSHPLTAPVLALDVCGSLVACGLMDGGHAVVRNLDDAFFVTTSSPLTRSLQADLSAAATGGECTEGLFSFKDHTKYVVCVAWRPGGGLLATVSHDKEVRCLLLPSTFRAPLIPFYASSPAGALLRTHVPR